MGGKLSSELRQVRTRFGNRGQREESMVDELMEINPAEPIEESAQNPPIEPMAEPLRTWYQCPDKAQRAPLPDRPVAWPSVLYEPQAELRVNIPQDFVPRDPSSCTSSPCSPRELKKRLARIAAYEAEQEAALQKAASQEPSSSTSSSVPVPIIAPSSPQRESSEFTSSSVPVPQQEIPAPPQKPPLSTPSPLIVPSQGTPAEVPIVETKGKPNGFNRAAKLALRTERHMQRHFSSIGVLEETRLRLLRMFRRKPKSKKRTGKKIGCMERLRNWRRPAQSPRSHSPPLPPPPYFPVLPTRGITAKQTMRLSELIHVVTQPPIVEERKFMGPKTQTKPFLMVHQTNEFEIMSTIGSFRLNPQLSAKRDTEGLGFEDRFPMLEEIIWEYNNNERMRRIYAYERKNKSLSLQEAYDIGHGKKPLGYGIAEAARTYDKPRIPVNRYPVVNCEEPVIGVPFKLFFKDVVDIPEYSIDVFRYINRNLDQFGVQLIDMRCRNEEILGQRPWIMDEDNIILDVHNAIIRSMSALHSIRTTAKYFVVYAFYSNNVPLRFLQMIVRFKSELSEDSVDWINDGVTRLQIEEDDPHPTI